MFPKAGVSELGTLTPICLGHKKAPLSFHFLLLSVATVILATDVKPVEISET